MLIEQLLVAKNQTNVQLPNSMARAFALALLTALSGCSDLVPGLNVRTGGNGTHQYKVVSDTESNEYKVVEAAPSPQYDVVPITADLLRTLAEQSADSPELLPSRIQTGSS